MAKHASGVREPSALVGMNLEDALTNCGCDFSVFPKDGALKVKMQIIVARFSLYKLHAIKLRVGVDVLCSAVHAHDKDYLGLCCLVRFLF